MISNYKNSDFMGHYRKWTARCLVFKRSAVIMKKLAPERYPIGHFRLLNDFSPKFGNQTVNFVRYTLQSITLAPISSLTVTGVRQNTENREMER